MTFIHTTNEKFVSVVVVSILLPPIACVLDLFYPLYGAVFIIRFELILTLTKGSQKVGFIEHQQNILLFFFTSHVQCF